MSPQPCGGNPLKAHWCEGGAELQACVHVWNGTCSLCLATLWLPSSSIFAMKPSRGIWGIWFFPRQISWTEHKISWKQTALNLAVLLAVWLGRQEPANIKSNRETCHLGTDTIKAWAATICGTNIFTVSGVTSICSCRAEHRRAPSAPEGKHMERFWRRSARSWLGQRAGSPEWTPKVE